MQYSQFGQRIKNSKFTGNPPTFCLYHSQSSNKSLYICLSQHCNMTTNTPNKLQHYGLNSKRILCEQCINQQKHSGHIIYNLNKFDDLFVEFNNANTITCKAITQKISVLRSDVNQLLDKMSNNVIQLLNFQPNSQSYTNGYINTKDNNQQIDNLQEINYLECLNISQWNEILRAKKIQGNSEKIIDKILLFKEDAINEQIQNILDMLRDSIKQSIQNIRFITSSKHLLFNPEDMHDCGVGLSLNRNILEAVQAQGKNIIHSLNKSQNVTSVALTGCKLAFTESPFHKDISKSFKIQKLGTKIFIGCTDQESHAIIADQFYYENCQRLVYGISICSEGQVIAYSKINSPVIIPHIKIFEGDIVELSIHAKQHTLSFIVYRPINPDQVDNRDGIGHKISSVYSSTLGEIEKLNVVSIDLEPEMKKIQAESPIYYCFAGVAQENDEVQLVNNVILIKKQSEQSHYPRNKQNIISVQDQQDMQILAYLQQRQSHY